MKHRCHGARSARFSRVMGAPSAPSAVRFRPRDCQAPPWSPGDAAPSRPSTLRPLAAMLAAQRAILHGVPRALALGAGRSRQRATPRRVWPSTLRCHHHNAHLHHLRAFRAIGHSPCCRRRRRRSSAGSSSSPPASKRMCGPGASASAHLAPWKGHRRCTFHRRRPPAPSAAIVTKNSSLRQRMRSSRQLRFAFSARYWALK